MGETTRLRLRLLRTDDIGEIAAMVEDPEQMRFYPRPKTRAEVADWLAWNLALYDERGFGTWYLESTLDRGFVGYCGIRPLVVDGDDEVELAWHVKKTYWNQGLATEAAGAAARLALERFGLARLVAMIHPDNEPSRRVAQKLGMAPERTVVHAGEPAVVYATAERGRLPASFGHLNAR